MIILNNKRLLRLITRNQEKMSSLKSSSKSSSKSGVADILERHSQNLSATLESSKKHSSSGRVPNDSSGVHDSRAAVDPRFTKVPIVNSNAEQSLAEQLLEETEELTRQKARHEARLAALGITTEPADTPRFAPIAPSPQRVAPSSQRVALDASSGGGRVDDCVDGHAGVALGASSGGGRVDGHAGVAPIAQSPQRVAPSSQRVALDASSGGGHAGVALGASSGVGRETVPNDPILYHLQKLCALTGLDRSVDLKNTQDVLAEEQGRHAKTQQLLSQRERKLQAHDELFRKFVDDLARLS